jgi:hypothetical protein
MRDHYIGKAELCVLAPMLAEDASQVLREPDVRFLGSSAQAVLPAASLRTRVIRNDCSNPISLDRQALEPADTPPIQLWLIA